MIDYTYCGLTQKQIGILAGNLDKSTVSRWLNKLDIVPIGKNVRTQKNMRYDVSSCRKILKEFVFRNYKSHPHVMSFYNFKGGTGKTSVCYQVSSHLAVMGFNVLLIDADPQSHLSTSYGFDTGFDIPTLYDIITGTVEVDKAIHEVLPGLSIIPSNLSLTRLEVVLNELPKREERVKICLEPYKSKYDFIIFDTNPTISLLNRNILFFSDLVSIVCETQPYSLNGLKLLMEDMHKFYKNMQGELPEVVVIPNKYEDRSSTGAEAMSVLRQFYRENTIPDFAIRKSEDIVTSAKLGMPLGFFAKSNSHAFQDISDLIYAILLRLSIQPSSQRKQADDES